MMEKLTYIKALILIIVTNAVIINAAAEKLVWPPAPDEPRLEFVDQIECKKLSEGKGFFSNLKNFISGKNENNMVTLPYDITVINDKIYLTCQGNANLIEIDEDRKNFKKYTNKEHPFSFPICLCDGGDDIVFITDCENKAVYKFTDGEIELFIKNGLERPTGITALPEKNRIYIIDTGEHSLKIFDYEGKFIREVKSELTDENKFHYPTFITATNDGFILVNDALNYKIKRFDYEGNFISSFGSEGNGPGAFSRPKGVASDSEGNIYVIDNLFDNLQILDTEGHPLLVIGAAGQQKGQFWSPSGIAISNDTLYIADTFNNRIQILHFLGGPDEK